MSTSITPGRHPEDEGREPEATGREMQDVEREPGEALQAERQPAGSSALPDPHSEPKPDEAPQGKSARRRSLIALAACFAFIGAVAAAMPFTPMMPVRGISVDGNVNLGDEDIQAATGIEVGTPIARVDVREAASNVAANPWVESATVSRDWPNAVGVEVVEHVPVAWVDQNGEPHLIDRDGRDFVVAPPPPGAVQLDGVSEEEMPAAVEVAAAITDRARPRVRALTTDGPYSFALVLDDDRTVYWGAAEDNHNKAIALETVLQMEGQAFNISNPELVSAS